MQSAAPRDKSTGMSAFFPLNFTQAKAIINAVQQSIPDCVLDIACINSPKHIVLSGDSDALAAAAEVVADPRFGVKAKAIKLDVSAPFHSSYMESTESVLKKRLIPYKMRLTTVPVISGFNHTLQRQVPDQLIENFVPLTSSTVNFMGAIEQANNILTTQSQSVEKAAWIEIGPKPTLGAFVTQTLDGITPISLSSAKDIRDLLNNREITDLLTGVKQKK